VSFGIPTIDRISGVPKLLRDNLTPASVTRYASQLRGLPWSCSAHAKDIWTSADWDLAGKLSSARWTVTCTKTGFDRLKKSLTATRLCI
jgi:hypothetical protein